LFDTASTVHEGVLDIVLEDVLDFAPSPVPSLPTDDGFSATMAAIDTAYEESQMVINEGRAMLDQMIGGSGDELMGDETAHLKQKADVIVDELYVDPDL
jgi:hypothetical protein